MNSSMSDDFLEWLNECPCNWIRLSDDEHCNSEYQFNEVMLE